MFEVQEVIFISGVIDFCTGSVYDEKKTREAAMKKKFHDSFRSALITLLLLAGATAAGFLFHHFHFPETNVVVVYILSVLLVARFTQGYGYGLAASVMALLMFNWFFTAPYYSLKVNDPTYIITFVIMTFTALLTSALTSKVKKVAARDKHKQMEMSALYQLTNHLTDAEDVQAIAGVAVNAVSQMLSTEAACICFDVNGVPEHTFLQQRRDGTQLRRRLDDPELLQHRMEALLQSMDVGPEFYDYPIYGRTSILAVMRVPAGDAALLTEDQTEMLHSVMESASLAMERLRSLQIQADIREQAAQERYRSNILRAISHDIRTPLSGILGTSEMLMDMTERGDSRHALAEDIHQDATWLHSLVENILSLTKLQDGRMSLKKEPEAVEEVIGAALMVMEKRLPGREISVSIPDSLLLVPMDARLISQVLINLMDNAGKHSSPDTEISVRVEPGEEEVRFTVSDRGTGIPEEALPLIFQMFYTTHTEGTGAQRGVGLGLSICQSIVEAHGGTITARNRTDGPGAEFTFTLPLGGDPS